MGTSNSALISIREATVMNVLVTGGAGDIGGDVTDALLKFGHVVRVYDLLLYEDDYRKPVSFIYGDIRDHDKLLPHLDWAEAAASGIGWQCRCTHPGHWSRYSVPSRRSAGHGQYYLHIPRNVS